ncbi:MAG: zf-TFIIB domain-containing protein [Pseudomonadota bacterium]|jgi:Zn-finger nucleic acid-binding protein
MSAECPRCAVALVAGVLQQVPVSRCPRCRGLWLEAHALEAARDAADADLATLGVELWSDPEQFRHAPRSGRCPTGDGALHALEYGHTGVTVDYCDACFGVWFDEREFERIVSALEREVDQRPASDYLRSALHEARELLTGPQPLLDDWRALRTVLRLLEYRVLSEHPGLHQRLLALQASNPFR